MTSRRYEGGKGRKEGWPGNVNLAVGGFKGAIHENGDPREDGEKRTAMARGNGAARSR